MTDLSRERRAGVSSVECARALALLAGQVSANQAKIYDIAHELPAWRVARIRAQRFRLRARLRYMRRFCGMLLREFWIDVREQTKRWRCERALRRLHETYSGNSARALRKLSNRIRGKGSHTHGMGP
jgi:hypothetical protein